MESLQIPSINPPTVHMLRHFYSPTTSELPINSYLPFKFSPHPHPNFMKLKTQSREIRFPGFDLQHRYF